MEDEKVSPDPSDSSGPTTPPKERRKRRVSVPDSPPDPVAPPPRFGSVPANNGRPRPPWRGTPVEPEISAAWLGEKYREMVPPGLTGDGLMRWYLAVQRGEELGGALNRFLNELLIHAENQGGQIEEMRREIQGIFRLLADLGQGLAALSRGAMLLNSGSPVGPTTPPPIQEKAQPRLSRVPTDRYVPPPEEQESLGDLVEQGERVGRPPTLTNAEAEEVMDFLRAQVPMGGSKLPPEQQLAVAERIGRHWLTEWSKPGRIRSQRWPGLLHLELEKSLLGMSQEQAISALDAAEPT